MGKLHDESKDLRSIGKIAKIDYATKNIQANKSAIIGNERWGKIDYLCHYCGWTFVYNNDINIYGAKANDDVDNNSKTSKKEAKRANRQKALTTNKRRNV